MRLCRTSNGKLPRYYQPQDASAPKKFSHLLQFLLSHMPASCTACSAQGHYLGVLQEFVHEDLLLILCPGTLQLLLLHLGLRVNHKGIVRGEGCSLTLASAQQLVWQLHRHDSSAGTIAMSKVPRKPPFWLPYAALCRHATNRICSAQGCDSSCRHSNSAAVPSTALPTARSCRGRQCIAPEASIYDLLK